MQYATHDAPVDQALGGIILDDTHHPYLDIPMAAVENMSARLPIKALIFDLGDVLFTWSAKTTTRIPPKSLHAILKSETWIDFDCGRITQSDCYESASQAFPPFTPEEIQEAFAQARESLTPNEPMVTAIKAFRETCKDTVKIFAMSNVSKEDYEFMAPDIKEWNVFDRVFASGYAGTRKPDLSFYRHVLREVDLQPQEVVFVDDKVENVLAAQSLGMRAFVFSDTDTVIDIVRRIRDDPYERGYRFLRQNDLTSITDNGIVVSDNFAKLLVQDTLPFCSEILSPHWPTPQKRRTWNFFTGAPVLIPSGKFPDDLDTTSLALTVLPPSLPSLSTSILDEMLTYLLPDASGLFQTYYSWSKPRTDPIVSANILACFCSHGRAREPGLQPTLDMVVTYLKERGYEEGSRYYSHADACLFFVGRLMRSGRSEGDREVLEGRLGGLLRERARERVGREGSSAIELAMRVVTCCELGIACRADAKALLEMQEEDGGWAAGCLYRYGSSGVHIGNRAVTTAMAMRAIASL